MEGRNDERTEQIQYNPLFQNVAIIMINCEIQCTVKPQWLEHFEDYGNLFEIWVVRATEEYSWHQVRKQMAIIWEKKFRPSTK